MFGDDELVNDVEMDWQLAQGISPAFTLCVLQTLQDAGCRTAGCRLQKFYYM